MKRILHLVLTLCLTAVSLPALSVNVNFLQNSATSQFDREDMKMMDAAIDKALQLSNGRRVTWKNHDTGSGGSVEALNTIKKNGMTCRNVRLINHSRRDQLKDHYVFMFCKHKDGWKMVG